MILRLSILFVVFLTGFVQSSIACPAVASHLDCMLEDGGKQRTVTVKVVDPNQQPLSQVRLEAWQLFYNPPPYPLDYKQKWKRMSVQKTDMDGTASFEVTDKLTSQLVIHAVPDKENSWVGRVSFNPLQIADSETKLLNVQTPVEFTSILVDYTTRKPVSGGTVKIIGYRFPDFEQEISRAKTESDGMFCLKNLDSEFTYALSYSHPDYVSFTTKKFKLSKSRPSQLVALSTADHERYLQAAKMIMPAVENLKPSDAFAALSHRFQEDASKFPKYSHYNQKPSLEESLDRLRTLPTDLYREAMWELLDRTPDESIQFKILEWLADYSNNGSDPKGRDWKAELVNRFADSKLLNSNLILSVRSQNDPVDALKSIIETNTLRKNRCSAAMQMAYHYSDGGFSKSNVKRDKLPNIADREKQCRKYLDLVFTQYSDVPNSGRSFGETAKHYIDFLDQFGDNGTPPVFEGQGLDGEPITFGGKSEAVSVLVYGGSDWSLLAQLEKLNKQRGLNTKLIGIGLAKTQDQLEKRVHKAGITSPIVFDSYRGMIYENHAFQEDRGGVQWTNRLKLGFLRSYRTILIDRDGVIRAKGLMGQELCDKVVELSKEKR